MDVIRGQARVPEIYGAFWFNSDPIPLGALRGYVILLDFWDYSCQNSLRTLPYVKEWHRRYSPQGLIVVGVHTPQFPFGSDPTNIVAALEKLSVPYPVVMDNDFLIWSAFRNTVWPTRYLIDKNGFMRYVQEGEGSYENFEHSIQSLLADAGYRDAFPQIMDPVRESDKAGTPMYRATPEVLTGWQRGTIGNVEGYGPESTIHYEDPEYYVKGRLYLHGDWLNDRSSVRVNESDGREAHAVIVYEAKEVNAVIEPNAEKHSQVFVKQDGAYLNPSNRGADVHVDEEGRSYIVIDRPRLYNLVRNREYGEHKLQLATRANGVAFYSISFVSCAVQEMIPNN